MSTITIQKISNETIQKNEETYYSKNKDKIKKYNKKYAKENSEKIQEYRDKSSEKMKQYNKIYKDKNRDEIRKKAAAYQKTKRELTKIIRPFFEMERLENETFTEFYKRKIQELKDAEVKP